MAPAPHRVYSQELSAAFRRGHPIAHPQPVEYQTGNSDGAGGVRRPVEIGDVGYIQPEHGYFIRLFNVHLEPGVDGQPTRNRLPDDFEVLPKDEITKVTDNTPIFLSRTVTTKNLTAAASGPFFGGSVEFSATSKRGAILATPDPIECTDAICIPIYMNHARAHIQSWYEFFSQRHLIELEDLILVTGVDHTTSWATAVIADTELEAGFGLNVQFATAGAGIQLACQYSWQSTFGALVNSGPPRGSDAIPETPTSTSLASPSYRLGIDADDGDASLQPLNSRNDQSLFVRHIRAKRRSRWLGMKLAAAGESDDTDDKGDDTDPDSCTDAIETGKEVLFVATSPGREDFVDCLEPVLDYILEHSDSDIALAHDNDIEILLATASSSNPIVNIQAGVGQISAYDTSTSAIADASSVTDHVLTSTHDTAPLTWTTRRNDPMPMPSGTSYPDSRDRQSATAFSPIPLNDTRRLSGFGSSSMRALPIPPVRSQTLGSPMFAWVRGPNGRLMPRRIRPRTLSSRTSRNASRNADDNPTDSPPVPAVPLTGVLLSPPISTPSTLPVEPQIAQTVAEPRSPHSGIHPARSDAIGGPSTPFVESNVGLYSPSQCSERDRSDSRETLATIFPLPRSAIVALFRRPRKDEGRPLPQPPSPFPYLHPVGFHPSTRLPGGGLPSTAGSPSIPPVAATSLFHINPHSPISPHRLRSSAAHTRNLREDVTEGSLKRPRGARPRSGLLQDRQ